VSFEVLREAIEKLDWSAGNLMPLLSSQDPLRTKTLRYPY